jgi:heme exporter protein B
MNVVLRQALIICAKDLRMELRSREVVLAMAYFGILVVLIFSFAFPVFSGAVSREQVVAGILWISITFAGTLGLQRAFEREREGDCIRALLLSPVPRPSIFLGKVFGMLLFMGVLEAVVLPAIFLFFNVSLPLDGFLVLALTIALGTVGYAVVGTLFAASLLRARSKDILLTIMLFPIILPVLMAGVKATSLILLPDGSQAELWVWVKVLATFDIIFTIVSLWIFEILVLD